jgi:hypothetical protein
VLECYGSLEVVIQIVLKLILFSYFGVILVSFRFVSFRFVSFRFVSFRFVSFRFVLFCLCGQHGAAGCPGFTILHFESRDLFT